MVILYTMEEDGTVFIRTDQLDGETDWKLRKAVTITQDYVKNNTEDALFSLTAGVKSEAPRLDIYKFEGLFTLEMVPSTLPKNSINTR